MIKSAHAGAYALQSSACACLEGLGSSMRHNVLVVLQTWTNPLRSADHSGLNSAAAEHAVSVAAAVAAEFDAATAAAAAGQDAGRDRRRSETDATAPTGNVSMRMGSTFTYPVPAAAAGGAVGKVYGHHQHHASVSDMSDAASASSHGKGQMIGFGNSMGPPRPAMGK